MAAWQSSVYQFRKTVSYPCQSSGAVCIYRLFRNHVLCMRTYSQREYCIRGSMYSLGCEYQSSAHVNFRFRIRAKMKAGHLSAGVRLHCV